MTLRLRLLWCWIKHVGRNVKHYWRLLRWWWRGTDYFKPFDTRSLDHSVDKCMIEAMEWLKRQEAKEA